MIPKLSLLAVGGRKFGLHVEFIRQVLDFPMIFPLPQINSRFLGVLLFQDQPVPVLNPGWIWPEINGHRGTPSLAVLLQGEMGDVGLPVDNISHIVDIDRGSWMEAEIEGENWAEKVFLFEENRYPLLNMDALLRHMAS